MMGWLGWAIPFLLHLCSVLQAHGLLWQAGGGKQDKAVGIGADVAAELEAGMREGISGCDVPNFRQKCIYVWPCKAPCSLVYCFGVPLCLSC